MPTPARGETDAAILNAFWAYILTPGFTLAFHAATLNRSLTSIATYRAKARAATKINPEILDLVKARVRAINAAAGLAMAQARGPAQLPFWSRQAIRDLSKRGWSRRELATAFQCAPGTIANVLQSKGSSWAPFSGERQLTDAQRSPPGQWTVLRGT